MASKEKSIFEEWARDYAKRRVHELREQGHSDQDIVQQLEAVVGKKVVIETLAAIRSGK